MACPGAAILKWFSRRAYWWLSVYKFGNNLLMGPHFPRLTLTARMKVKQMQQRKGERVWGGSVLSPWQPPLLPGVHRRGGGPIYFHYEKEMYLLSVIPVKLDRNPCSESTMSMQSQCILLWSLPDLGQKVETSWDINAIIFVSNRFPYIHLKKLSWESWWLLPGRPLQSRRISLYISEAWLCKHGLGCLLSCVQYARAPQKKQFTCSK